MKLVRLVFCFFVFAFAAEVNMFAQDQSKGVPPKPEKVEPERNRPRAAVSAFTSTNPKKAKKYRILSRSTSKTPNVATKQPTKQMPTTEVVMEPADLGLTFWRLGPATEDERAKFEVESDPATRKPILAKRESYQAEFADGDFVRISLESTSHDGYLYVFNREKFADGSYGKTVMIFPSESDGNTHVQPGDLVFVPGPPNTVSFVIEANPEKKRVAEQLIVIVSPKMLIPAANLKDEMEISDEQIYKWMAQWEMPMTVRESEDGKGEALTKVEANAGVQAKGIRVRKPLTQDDPPPQTVFNMQVVKGNPVFAIMELKIKPL